jgi:hypothetical protein
VFVFLMALGSNSGDVAFDYKRYVVGETRREHTGKRPDAPQHITLVGNDPRRIAVPDGRRHAQGQYIFGAAANIDGPELQESLDEKARAGKQHESQSHLRADRQAAEAARPRRRGKRTGTQLKRMVEASRRT